MKNILKKQELNYEDIIALFSLQKKEDIDYLFQYAYSIKNKYVGNTVYFRGIIEMSNICSKNCYYCGIRKDNSNIERYMMSNEEIIEAAKFAFEQDYGSIVIQTGEINSKSFVLNIEKLIKEIKQFSNDKLGITLSLGEQSEETYKRWYEAGAHRYLLRIETSNRELYAKLHPSDHSYYNRKKCLEILSKLGYQTGTGVMIGLPYQTIEHLAEDIIFFKQMNIDMLGMGPFIPHNETPFKDIFEDFDSMKKQQLELSLKMIAITRIVLKDVNIAATTALQALDPFGREKGIMAGANIIMPNITDKKYRKNYKLYENKPCMDENATECRHCLENRILNLGERIGYNKWGDSPHYFKRINR